MAGNFPSLDTIQTILQNIVKAISSLNQTINNIFPSATGTATSATAGSATLPAQPAGVVTVVVNGATVKVPYYLP